MADLQIVLGTKQVVINGTIKLLISSALHSCRYNKCLHTNLVYFTTRFQYSGHFSLCPLLHPAHPTAIILLNMCSCPVTIQMYLKSWKCGNITSVQKVPFPLVIDIYVLNTLIIHIKYGNNNKCQIFIIMIVTYYTNGEIHIYNKAKNVGSIKQAIVCVMYMYQYTQFLTLFQ